MSNLIGAAQPNIRHCDQDLRLNRADFQPRGRIFTDLMMVAPAGFCTEWWPGSAFAGDGGTDVGMLEARWWGEYDQTSGASSAFGVAGVTRDQYGSAIAGCTVKLFLTATDAKLDEVVSGTDGTFTLRTVYYPDTHYIVATKTGAPTVQGASVNTLVGA